MASFVTTADYKRLLPPKVYAFCRECRRALLLETLGIDVIAEILRDTGEFTG